MGSLTTAIAVAVSCSVLFVVAGVIGTIVWLRLRQERLSLAIANARGRHGRGLQNFAADTVTELSHEEGSALRQYGQLPYGNPTEWGVLNSRETLPPTTPSESAPTFHEKARSLRSSFTLSRSKSRSQSKLLGKKSHFGSLRSLAKSTKNPDPPGTPCLPKEDVLLSPVEGVLELPAVTTPKQSPDGEDDRASELNITPWPVIPQRQPASLCPVFEDQHELEPRTTRVRGGSITTKTAGMAPARPAPPPPVAYPPNRFSLSRSDSAIRLSSLSVDTAESSIWDDSMRVSTLDGKSTSPSLPPCPSFTPFSPNDVGKGYNRVSFAESKATLSAFPSFATNSTLSDCSQTEPGRVSPRRSQTARHPSHGTEHAYQAPRRSESLSANRHARESRFGLHLNPARPESALLPHFSQLQHNQPGGHVARGSVHRNSQEVPSRTASLLEQRTPPRAPESLFSSSKGRRGSRKGHRRQNCVRISIRPPYAFESSQFPPTFEEPEEVEEKGDNTTEVFNLSTSNNPSPNPKVPPISIDSSDLGTSAAQDPHYAPLTPTKKRKHCLPEGDPFASEENKNLPGIFTTLPSNDASLSCTPSPEKGVPLWPMNAQRSPTVHENPSTGSPRRSAVKGPRSLPGKKSSSAHKSPASSGKNMPSTISDPQSRLPRPADPGNPRDGQYQGNTSPQRDGGEPESKRKSLSTQPSPGAKKTPCNNNGNSIPIWEDGKLTRSPTKKSPAFQSTVIELERRSPRRLERHKSTARSKRASLKSGPPPSRQNFTTPTRSRVGLGIATPGSLYDRDGFLRE